MHEHHDCDHQLKYCKTCDVTYCAKCHREWGLYRTWTPYPWYTNPWYQYQTGTTYKSNTGGSQAVDVLNDYLSVPAHTHS